MKNILCVERIKTIIIALLIIAFGVLFIALPNESYAILITIMSWLLIGIGLFWIAGFLATMKVQVSSVPFINGLIMLCLGMLLLFIPSLFIAIIGFAVAFAGVQYIGAGINQKLAGQKIWWQDFIYGLFEFALGIILVVARYSALTESVLMIYLGVCLIINGLFILLAMLIVRKTLKDFNKNLEIENEK